ncbi:MAG: ATP-binding protein, partial [Patescibacteria group bacterium]
MAITKAEKVKKTAPKTGQSHTKGSYGASDITVLEGLEAVRRRPGMYIGTTGTSGLHHLIWEVFDNSRDEAMGDFANDIEIALLPGNRVRVADNGRGIPVEIHPKTKVSTLETVMTMLHAGGKFGGEGYKVSGGLHGVGVSVVNALSTHLRAEVHRDGGQYLQEYKNGGKPAGKTKKIGTSKLHGTIITFQSDGSIFPDRELNWDTIVSHMRQQAYLVKGLRVSILDLRGSTSLTASNMDEDVFYIRELGLDAPSVTFYFEGGLRSLVSFQNHHLETVHKTVFYVEKEQDGVHVEVALQYVDDITSRISAFANNIYNAEGGTHITGFKTALTRTLNAKNGNGSAKGGSSSGGKESDSFTGDDVLEGLTAVVSVKLREIQFEGQTKGKLGSVEARGAVETVFGEAFNTFLEEHPEEARAIFGKITLAMKARKAAKAAKDSILRKGALDGMTLPGKLADCQSKSAEESELFIVEGDSAGGTAKMGRDRRIQAVLPLRGKILNIERARLDKMLASEQIRNLVVALGTAIGDIFDVAKLRYHKIIIATDAD